MHHSKPVLCPSDTTEHKQKHSLHTSLLQDISNPENVSAHHVLLVNSSLFSQEIALQEKRKPLSLWFHKLRNLFRSPDRHGDYIRLHRHPTGARPYQHNAAANQICRAKAESRLKAPTQLTFCEFKGEAALSFQLMPSQGPAPCPTHEITWHSITAILQGTHRHPMIARLPGNGSRAKMCPFWLLQGYELLILAKHLHNTGARRSMLPLFPEIVSLSPILNYSSYPAPHVHSKVTVPPL